MEFTKNTAVAIDLDTNKKTIALIIDLFDFCNMTEESYIDLLLSVREETVNKLIETDIVNVLKPKCN